jgi:hypothetical protein
MRIYLRVSTLAAGLIALGFLVPAIGVGQPPKTEAKGTITAPAKPQMKVKVFKLERADPQAVLIGLNNLLEDSDMEMPAPMPPVNIPPAGVPVPPPMGMLGFAGVPPAGFGGVPGAGFGGIGGGIGFGGGVAAPTVPQWRATVDDRTKAVIVRGSEKHLKVAADLVAILDRPANAPLPQLQIVKAFALKHADSQELAQVIAALEFEDVKLSSPDEKLLAVIGPDEVTKAIAEIVKELDVPTKNQDKKEPEEKK